MDEKKSFVFEIVVYRFIAEMIEFFESQMDKDDWIMLPSRFYRMISETIGWCRSKDLWHFNQPAFLYVMEQCDTRAKMLSGTHDDASRKMEMETWRDRKPPVPGGDLSILQIFDWFLPILRGMESNMVRYFGNPDETTSGHEFTAYEAWNTVFMVIDKLSKDPRFGTRNAWGWAVPYPWVDFVRDEMYGWNQALLPGAPPVDPNDDPPFSTP